MSNTKIVDKVNKDLKEIDERLTLTFDLEDVYGQDFEEYGINDIEDTRHFALLLTNKNELGSTVIKEHFGFNVRRSLTFGRSDADYLENIGFTREKIRSIEQILLSHAK